MKKTAEEILAEAMIVAVKVRYSPLEDAALTIAEAFSSYYLDGMNEMLDTVEERLAKRSAVTVIPLPVLPGWCPQCHTRQASKHDFPYCSGICREAAQRDADPRRI